MYRLLLVLVLATTPAMGKQLADIQKELAETVFYYLEIRESVIDPCLLALADKNPHDFRDGGRTDQDIIQLLFDVNPDLYALVQDASDEIIQPMVEGLDKDARYEIYELSLYACIAGDGIW